MDATDWNNPSDQSEWSIQFIFATMEYEYRCDYAYSICTCYFEIRWNLLLYILGHGATLISCWSSRQNLASHLVTMMYSRDNLPEEVSRLSLAKLTPLADVVVQLSFAGILHHNDNFVLILEHCDWENTQIMWLCHLHSSWLIIMVILFKAVKLGWIPDMESQARKRD